jgi:hypothetical protein
VRLARLKGNTQRHAFTEQVLLADHFNQILGTQPLGQRLMMGWHGFHQSLLWTTEQAVCSSVRRRG